MRIKAITTASAILWGASMFIVGIIHLGFPSYGTDFLNVMSSVYPGLHTTRTIWEVLLGTCYGFVDGAVGGYVFGMLYRWTAGTQDQVNSGDRSSATSAMPYRRAS